MKRYNTPHRSRVVKTRMTEEEYAEFAERLSAYNMILPGLLLTVTG